VKNDFFDDLKMTETFAAFCGDGLSFSCFKLLVQQYALIFFEIAYEQ
jgi:hypothetical protein